MINNNYNKPLLIIGNGFDLHLRLNSSFENFIKDDICKINDNIIFKIIGHSSNGFSINVFEKSNFNVLNDFEYIKNFPADDPKIDILSDSIFTSIGNINKTMYHIEYTTSNKYNFWNIYFVFLEKAIKENTIKSNELKNWNDIESQIDYFFANTIEFLNFYVKYYKLMLNGQKNRPDTYDEYTNEDKKYFLDNNGQFSDIGIVRLISIYILLYVGWNPEYENVYEFLLKELKKFESQFKDYLNIKVNSFNDYNNSANKLAIDLTGSREYNLINFNYTSFYNLDDSTKYNIHSILSNQPIFGIGDNDYMGNELTSKPYYMFTKTYRIMSLANTSNFSKTLNKEINKIIFYGHSLSDADYAYFRSIFDYYDIYSSNTTIIFGYSTFSENPESDKRNQFNSVYKLITNYGHDTSHNNLLNKLLIENRLKFKKIK